MAKYYILKSWVSHENRIGVIYTTGEAIARSRDYHTC